MAINGLAAELLSQLAEPFTGEALFDCLGDLVFFIKNRRAEYVVVNETLVKRCGKMHKQELLGRRADKLFPPPLGHTYRQQDERVLRGGTPMFNQLELHFYSTGARGWCVTNKLPLRDRSGQIVGLVGISKDLQAANERGEDYARVAEVISHIQTHFADDLRVGELAEDAGLSIYQFEERIRSIFQLTAWQLILKARMDHAVRQLRETDAPIADIALSSGYSDQSAFTRQFRLMIGLTPSEYRRNFCGPAKANNGSSD
jgi:AraC-like DNA-binding protein